MEIVCIVPWVRSLTVPTSSLTTVEAITLLLGAGSAAMVLARLIRRPGTRAAVLLAALLGYLLLALRIVIYRGAPVRFGDLILRSFASFASVLTLVPAELIVILAVVFAWRRGVAGASDPVLDPSSTAHRVRLGVLAHVAFAVIYGAGGAARLLEVLPLYFAAGLTAVAMSRADGLRRFRDAARSPFTLPWLAGVLSLVLGTVALGVVVAGLLSSPPFLEGARGIARRLVQGAQLILVAVGPAVVWIVTLLERAVAWTSRAFDLGPALVRLRGAIPEIPQPAPEPPVEESWLEPYGPSLQILATTLAVVVLVLVAIRVRQVTRGEGHSREGRSERIPAAVPQRPDLRGILARARAGLDRARRLRRRFLAAAAIRRIYAQLLVLAQNRGRPRQPAQTPREFMPDLWALFPGRREDVELITEEYLKVRYGEYPEAVETVAAVRAAWSRLTGEVRPHAGV
jgi:hypothetical protein